MIVYALGKQAQESAMFNVSVPPTQPGYVVQEIPLGKLMGIASMLATLGLRARRKYTIIIPFF